MAISFNHALGIEPQALLLREKRGEVLAANLANADTPDYKARDLEFKAALNESLSESGQNGLTRTSEMHLQARQNVLGAELMFRNPQQASLDGNTVETQIEQAKYGQNAIQYEASLNFLKNEFSGLMTAIKGQ